MEFLTWLLCFWKTLQQRVARELKVRDGYLLSCAVLVLTAVGIPAMWDLQASWPSNLDSWRASLSEPSQVIVPAAAAASAAASESRFSFSGFDLMLSKLTQGNFDMTHQLSAGPNSWPFSYVKYCCYTEYWCLETFYFIYLFWIVYLGNTFILY